MNKTINIWILLLLLLLLPFGLAVGFNIDYTLFGWDIQGEELAGKQYIFNLGSGLILVLGVFKTVNRWLGMSMLYQKNKFRYSNAIASARIKRVLLYGIIEIVFLSIFSAFFFVLTTDTWVISAALLIILLEHLLHMILGYWIGLFRYGITKKAFVAVDRASSVIYFNGLRRISKHQDTIYFDYSNNLVLHIPTNLFEDEGEFLLNLKSVINTDKVFIEGF